MSKTVSILMPVYKTAPYLREAMDSILAQTFTDFELIVLNDCSPDNAEEILDNYDDHRIVRYSGTKNEGLANVLNIGISMARGHYIARMDSDDISLPTRIETQLNFIESHLPTTVKHFSYPHSMESLKIQTMLKEAGYESATMGYGGTVRKGDNLYKLNRKYIVQS